LPILETLSRAPPDRFRELPYPQEIGRGGPNAIAAPATPPLSSICGHFRCAGAVRVRRGALWGMWGTVTGRVLPGSAGHKALLT
jgi:hypothetical protein